MNEQNSFQKGWYRTKQGEAAEVRRKISAALGITTRVSFLNRLNGDVTHNPAEREALEKIFAGYGITEIWGKV